MFLKSIAVKNFKKFPEASVVFPGDITIIKGPNEKGKSTLLAAILAGLFYDPKKSNKDIAALQAWNTEELYTITLSLEHKGEDIVLYKNFETKELLLENKTTGKKMTTTAETASYLYEIGALRSLGLFENTACVRHDALAQMTEGKNEIAQALEELITSAGEHVSVAKVLKKVTDAVGIIQRGMRGQAKTPGLLKGIENDMTVLSAKRDTAIAELKDIAEKSTYLSEQVATYHRITDEYEIKQRQYQKNAGYFKATEELKRLHAQLESIDADARVLEDSEKRKKAIEVELEAQVMLKTFDKDKWYAQREAINVKKAQLSHITEEEKSMKKEKKKMQLHLKRSHFLISLVLFATGFLGFTDTRLFTLWGVFLAAFVYSFVLKYGFIVHTPEKMRTEGMALSHEVGILEKQRNQFMDAIGADNEEALFIRVKHYDELMQERAKLASKEEGLLRGKTYEDFVKERNELFKRIGIEEAKITDEEKAVPPSSEVQRGLEADIEKRRQELDRLGKEIAHVDALIHASPYDHEMLAEIEEECERKQQQKENITHKLATLEMLKGALEEARAKTIAVSRGAIEEYMRKYLPVITGGRYDNVTVKDDLSFEVWSGEKKGLIVPEEHLSKGTIDQFYLIARFAVLNLLNKGVKSLVLLDDPFAGFDAGRKDRAREIFSDMTGAFQIIIFTHSSEYDDWGTVVEL